MTISEREVRTMLRLAHVADGEDSGQPLPWSVFTGLKELIGSDAVQLCQFDAKQRVEMLCQELSDLHPSEADLAEIEGSYEDSFWQHYWSSPPCAYPDTSGDVASVTKASDFLTDREFHNSPMYIEYLKLFGGEREMMLCLPSQPGRVLRLLFWRGPGRDFTERDRGLLTLLRPHLYETFKRRQRPKVALPTLTPRQTELMKLVAVGYTNNQVARRLSVSEATVRKHLENIFERLQVDSRTAAVTRVLGAEYGIR
ncbi:hypothetical protein MB27_24080 [Actinoplanes utahensis]|uniref:HTH luxR-type domain-containing protein n=2 Tax=Actinoplanes utahensis TaxID=1869 RepID=A0A0A6X4Z1_ACTUT|nr:hypothetical protein MB27_24080 [Actinoplanes utahensis]